LYDIELSRSAFLEHHRIHTTITHITIMNSSVTSPIHLKPDTWSKANLLLICKMISELAHESVIEPTLTESGEPWQLYTLHVPDKPTTEYRFQVQKLSLNHWYLRDHSLIRLENGLQVQPDAVQFVLEFKTSLGIRRESLPDYLEEILGTLYSFAYMLDKKSLTSQELVHKDFQTIEHAMTTGHPSFIANNGRIGFDAADYLQFTPEADQTIHLVWIAGHKSRAAYNAIESLSYETLLRKEIGDQMISHFDSALKQKRLDPADYVYMPVHPWQWHNKVAQLFASDIARNLLVLLDTTPDRYSVQQSLRTLFNQSHPEKFYVKTSLSILNMGFVRGMSPYFMSSTPPITTWIKETLENDPYIRKTGFTMICEVATVGYRHSYYEEFGSVFPQNKMLAALWRESPILVTSPGQQLMTMAALLHIDKEGEALLKHLIKASGQSTENWLRQYLSCYLSPLLHCFYAHDLTFMPHGENVLLVLEKHLPVKILMKDITEEICVFNSGNDMPEKARRVCSDVPDDIRVLNILVDIMDGYFRFLTQILVGHCDISDHVFWQLVAENILSYQEEHPQYKDKYRQFDLFADEFKRSCLNRLQLRNHKQMVNTGDADALTGLQYVGTLQNPLAVSLKKLRASHEVQDYQTI